MKNKNLKENLDQASLSKRLREIIDVMAQVGSGALDKQMTVTSSGVVGELELAFNEMITNLREREQAATELALENARLSELRNTELETIAKVSDLAAQVLEPDTFLQRAIDLIKEEFSLYHAHTYLLNEAGEILDLAVGTGEAGSRMVAEEWYIPLEQEQSLVARAARSRQGVIVNDVRENPDFMPHELLPHTRSEMAVPMIAGERLLGVLDLQADELNRFGEEEIRVYTTLAAQIAVALQNARQAATLESERSTLQAIVENIPAGVFVAEVPSGKPLLANKRAEEMLGRGISPDVETDGLAEVYAVYRYGTEELYPQTEMPLVRGMSGDITSVDDMEIRRPDGRDILVQVFGSPIVDASGQVIASVAIFQDITERKQTEEALRENQTRLSEALELARLAYWEFDVETQTFTFNDQIYDLYGTTAEQEGGYQMPAEEFVRRFVHPDGAENAGLQIQRAIETADPNYMAQFEDRLVRRDGNQIYIIVQVKTQKDQTGRTIKLYGTNQDITDRKQTEFLLEERVKELNCLNDIGREMEGSPPIPELLQWITERVPPAMQYPDLAIVAIEFYDRVYGNPKAIELKSQMTHGLYVGGQLIGRVYIAYTEKRDFLNEESALLGGVATRLSGYIENRRLFEQMERRAEREQLVNTITQRIQSKMTMESALQTAVEELGRAFQARYTRVELSPRAKTDGNGKLSKAKK